LRIAAEQDLHRSCSTNCSRRLESQATGEAYHWLIRYLHLVSRQCAKCKRVNFAKREVSIVIHRAFTPMCGMHFDNGIRLGIYPKIFETVER